MNKLRVLDMAIWSYLFSASSLLITRCMSTSSIHPLQLKYIFGGNQTIDSVRHATHDEPIPQNDKKLIKFTFKWLLSISWVGLQLLMFENFLNILVIFQRVLRNWRTSFDHYNKFNEVAKRTNAFNLKSPEMHMEV